MKQVSDTSRTRPAARQEIASKPASNHPASESLYEQRRSSHLDVAGLGKPPSHHFLDEYAAGSQLVWPQLLEICHLACSEEDLRLTELVHVSILAKTHNKLIILYHKLKIAHQFMKQINSYYHAFKTIFKTTAIIIKYQYRYTYIYIYIYIQLSSLLN